MAVGFHDLIERFRSGRYCRFCFFISPELFSITITYSRNFGYSCRRTSPLNARRMLSRRLSILQKSMNSDQRTETPRQLRRFYLSLSLILSTPKRFVFILARLLPWVRDGASRKVRKDSAILAPLFDAEFYLTQNPDVKVSGSDPLLHYIRYGAPGGAGSKSFV